MTLTDRLPTDGAMGALRRKRPTLYLLVVLTAGAAFAGVVIALYYLVALLPLIGAQAIVAVTANDPVAAWAWTLLLFVVGVGFVAVVVAVGRWVGEFIGGGEND